MIKLTKTNEVSPFVVVRFESGVKRYAFKNDVAGLVLGDLVVVDTAVGYTVGKIVDFQATSKLAVKWVVQKVDLEGHTNRKAKLKRLEEIRAKMETRRKELEEIEIFRILAKEDEGMAELLREMQELSM